MNGYTFLELGGKVRGIKFGNKAILDFGTKNKASLGQMTFSFDVIVDLIYFGLMNNLYIKREDADFTYDDVIAWCDDLPMEKLMGIFEVFKGAQLVDDSKKSKGKK